ncbi:MAG: DUF4186 domain-containing protein [Nanobdellota archaeon]
MDILERLGKSGFRGSFRLEDTSYIKKKGLGIIEKHAYEFLDKNIRERPANDGKQTPWKGHPVFTAQHATATCCRKCIEKWHKIPKGKKLDEKDMNYLKDIIMRWIKRESPQMKEKQERLF